MKIFWNLFCSAFIALVLFSSVGAAIKCFQCTSVNNTRCLDIKSNETFVDFYKECNGYYGGKTPFCRKTTQTIIDGEHITRVHRTCGWEDDPHNRKPCYTYDNDFHIEVVCVCNTDGCNAAPAILTPTSQILLALLAAIALLFPRIPR